MLLTAGSVQDARDIALIYKKAFPASIRRFFNEKPRAELWDLLELSFQLVFLWGGRALLAKNNENSLLGYCLYAKSTGRRNLPGVLKTAPLILGKIKPAEAGRLTYNQILKFLHKQRTKTILQKRGASIISIAVAPQFQGRGIGTVLLNEVLGELAQETVFLNVRKENRPARLLYKQAGFTAYGSTKDLLGEWVMLKRPPVF
ncbi:MAG TPA: GNAT family N-acetyltransferase [Firmicutes bacterium]|nr:GNAT family N-acetyltransferase [Bacillota bacterium]